jgi:alcohol dehydrogenase class IV
MVNPAAFLFNRTPSLCFGPGCFRELAARTRPFGSKILLITGRGSLAASGKKADLLRDFQNLDMTCRDYAVMAEPTPEIVDQAVRDFGAWSPEAVVAIGGGSVLDAGKAIAAMLPLAEPVQDYLEGVGSKRHPGKKIPFLAVPTTAGTGTEATKNASLRRLGQVGFKNSACGMDALAQLLEAYVSPQASPLTDALAESGLQAAGESLLTAYAQGDSLEARSGMAYAAFLSGVALANAGLGIIHSLASAIGGFFDIPHGVICGTLLAPGMRANIAKLKAMKNESGLAKHARAWQALSGYQHESAHEDCEALTDLLESWSAEMNLPRLGTYGLEKNDLDRILAKAALRNNPVKLEQEEIREIVLARI